MGQQDDLDRLLREIDAMNAGNPASAPKGEVAPRPGSAPATPSRGEAARSEAKGTRGGRLAWTGVSAVGAGAAGGVLGTVLTFLPAVSTLSTAVGAAVGGALVAFVSGPPRWFDQE
jgi:hypothetical protein